MSVAGWLGAMVFSAMTLCGAAVILKLFGKVKFEWIGVAIELKYFGFVMGGFTVAHAYITWLFVASCRQLQTLNPETRRDIWRRLTVEDGPLLFRAMEPRTALEPVLLPFVGYRNLHVMSPWDPTTWLLCACAALLFLSVLRVRRVSWRSRLLSLGLASLLVLVNWVLGSVWAISASRIAN
jgi:hypothetical protein